MHDCARFFVISHKILVMGNLYEGGGEGAVNAGQSFSLTYPVFTDWNWIRMALLAYMPHYFKSLLTRLDEKKIKLKGGM